MLHRTKFTTVLFPVGGGKTGAPIEPDLRYTFSLAKTGTGVCSFNRYFLRHLTLSSFSANHDFGCFNNCGCSISSLQAQLIGCIACDHSSEELLADSESNLSE